MKTEGLFRKITREGVSANQSRRIKDGWLGLDQREERRKGSGRNSDAGGKLHGRRRGGHWRARIGAYRPRFEEPKAPGDGGGSREPVQAKNGASGRGWRGGRHGRRPKLAGTRNNGHTSRQKPREKVREREESTAILTTAKIGAEAARGR